MFFILNMVVQPKMHYHGNQFFKILVKDVSFILVKTDSRYHNYNQRYCISA